MRKGRRSICSSQAITRITGSKVTCLCCNRGETTRLSAARAFSTKIAKRVAKWETHILLYKCLQPRILCFSSSFFPNRHLFWRGAGSRARACAICCYLYEVKRARVCSKVNIYYFCEICAGGVKKAKYHCSFLEKCLCGRLWGFL